MWIKWSGLILFYLNGLKAPKQLVGKNWITLAISDSVSTVLALWQGNHDGFYLLLWITSVGPKRVWPTCSATSSCPFGGPTTARSLWGWRGCWTEEEQQREASPLPQAPLPSRTELWAAPGACLLLATHPAPSWLAAAEMCTVSLQSVRL